jgi:hypothetical protein
VIPEPSVFAVSTSNPLSKDEYVLALTNSGVVESSGPVTVTVKLPEGLTTSGTASGSEWSCTPGEGLSVFTCTSEVGTPPLHSMRQITAPITVSGTASSGAVGEARVSGGVSGCGGVGQRCPEAAVQLVSHVEEEPAAFEAQQFEAGLVGGLGEPAIEAGGHPRGLITGITFPAATAFAGLAGGEVETYPIENVKQIVVDLPAGVIGNARSTPTCDVSTASTEGFNTEGCPASSQVGTLDLFTPGNQSRQLIFNIKPEHGYPAEFAVYLPSLERSVFLYATLGPGPEYAARVISAPADRFLKIDGLTTAFYGVPAAVNADGLTPEPFFTNSTDCSASGFTTSIHVDSWQHSGRFNGDGSPDFSDPNWKGASVTSPPVTGCAGLRFAPSMTFSLDTGTGDAAEGAGGQSFFGEWP